MAMRLVFRPLPVFTLCAAVAFALLVSLGVWQVQRLHWKLGLIAQVNRALALPPVSLDEALKMGKGAAYRRVALSGRFDNAGEVYVYATADGAPVYHVLVPFIGDDGRVMIVDRGIVPPELRDPKTRAAGLLAGERRVAGVWRTPDAPGLFTPAPDYDRRVWHLPDAKSIAAFEHLKLAAPAVVEADATPNPGGWPKGGQTVVAFRNEHLQYAITWFGLAVVLLAVYVAYHVSRGRLSLR